MNKRVNPLKMTPSQRELIQIVKTIKGGRNRVPGSSVITSNHSVQRNAAAAHASTHGGPTSSLNLNQKMRASNQRVKKVHPNKSGLEAFDSLNQSLGMTASIDGGNSL
jgi:hypothetical protein